MTYDDLITGLRDALRQKGGKALAHAIGEKYSTALIDEFQDTDPAQCEIFLTIFRSKDHRLFLIGDPKQAIYGFRGATYSPTSRHLEFPDRQFTLVTNWRSERAASHKEMNALFAQAEAPFIFHSRSNTIGPLATETDCRGLKERWRPSEPCVSGCSNRRGEPNRVKPGESY